MMREGRVVGVDHRQRGRSPAPFADNHVQLLQTFADQAVIAIENVRLFERGAGAHARLANRWSSRRRRRRFCKVISSSTGELRAGVPDASLENATRICGAQFRSSCTV